MGLDRQCQQQTGDCGLDHDVGQHQHLDNRINGTRDLRDIGKDCGLAALDVADPEQQNVGGGLHHGQRHDRPHEVVARDHAVESGDKQPGGDREREEAHDCFPLRINSAWSRK